MATKFRLEGSPYTVESSKYIDIDDYDCRIAELSHKPAKSSSQNEPSSSILNDYDAMEDLGEGEYPTDERYGRDRIDRILSSPGRDLVAMGMRKAEELVGETAFSYVEAGLKHVSGAASRLWDVAKHVPVPEMVLDVIHTTRPTITGAPMTNEYRKFEGKSNTVKTGKMKPRTKKRMPLSGSGGLIEVSDSEGSESWFGAWSEDEDNKPRDGEYMDTEQDYFGDRVKVQKSQHADREETPYKPGEKKAGKQKAIESSSGSSNPYHIDRGYQFAEGYDSDFDVEGGVDWPLSDEAKEKHMKKMASRNQKHATASSKAHDPYRRRVKKQVSVRKEQPSVEKEQAHVRKEQADIQATRAPKSSKQHVLKSEEENQIQAQRAKRAMAIYQERRQREREERQATREREGKIQMEAEERIHAELEGWPSAPQRYRH